MLGETGSEQFSITVFVDGKHLNTQKIHDPFIRNTTTVGLSRWDLFKALFRKQYECKITVQVDGSRGAVSTIMMLNPDELAQKFRGIGVTQQEGMNAYSKGR